MKSLFILLYLTFILSEAFAQQVPLPKGGQERVTLYQNNPWHKTLEGIKAQVQTLVVANDQLNNTYQSLLLEQKQLVAAIDAKFKSNEALKYFIDSGGVKSDQQSGIDAMYAKLKDQQSQLDAQHLDVDQVSVRAQEVKRRLDFKRMQISEHELYAGRGVKPGVAPPSAASGSDNTAVGRLRKELEESRQQEAILANRVNALSGKSSSQQDIVWLKDKKEQLLKHKSQLLQQVSSTGDQSIDRGQIALMAAKKIKLEDKIAGYETKIKMFKEGALSYGLGGETRIKQLVKEMAAQDNKNARLRTKINNLKDDIILLKQRIAGLERRMNFSGTKTR